MSADVFAITTWRGAAAGISWVEPRDLLNILQCTGQFPQQRRIPCKTSLAQRLRNFVLQRFRS